MPRLRTHGWVRVGRAKFAALTLGAMGYQFRASQSDPDFDPATFFSYFTIESNITGAAALLWGSLTDGEHDSPTVDYLRGAATLYLAITGVVYAALLAGPTPEDQAPPTRDEKIVNAIVHQILPVVMTVDWLLVPPRNQLAFRKALLWLTGPLAFAGYSIVRGPKVDWYPYPFLDPREPGGYKSIAGYSVGIAVGTAAFSWALVALGNWRRNAVLDDEALATATESDQ
jgi:hypothetical protein